MIEHLENDHALLIEGDCLEVMRSMPDNSVDLVMCSPPYEDARTYGIDFNLRDEEWVAWAAERYLECYRICRGLVCWVVEGKTRKFRYSATPILLQADLHRRGVKLRHPIAFYRVGIPGSGGPDWLRNDWEFMICATHGKLPWSDNTAMGHPPKWAPGGGMSNRTVDGGRVKGKNQWGHSINSGATVVDEGGVVRSKGKRPSHQLGTGQNLKDGEFKQRSRHDLTRPREGMQGDKQFPYPVLANPGNVIEEEMSLLASLRHRAAEIDIDSLEQWERQFLEQYMLKPSDVSRHIVGGGVMGSRLAHDNEAPYPESLCNFIIKSFCPPGGVVFDPFVGSGTTVASAIKNGRYGIGVDVRKSQIDLSVRRVEEALAFLEEAREDIRHRKRRTGNRRGADTTGKSATR